MNTKGETDGSADCDPPPSTVVLKDEKLKRVISGIVIVLVTFPVLFLTDTLVLTAYMTFVAVVGVYELLRCIKLDKPYIIIPAECIAVACHVTARLRLFGGTDIPRDKLVLVYLFMAAAFMFYLFALCVFMPDKYNIETNGFGALMFVYVVAGTVSAVLITDEPRGKFAFPLIFISAWMTDVFAYLIGSKFGKHKLCPAVSPKKSVEGAIGGIAGNVIGTVIYAFIIAYVFRKTSAAYPALMLVSVVLSVISQLGDLIMSLVKRRFGIKDFGKIVPGHGGILDRFDSITAVSIVIYITYILIESSRGFI